MRMRTVYRTAIQPVVRCHIIQKVVGDGKSSNFPVEVFGCGSFVSYCRKQKKSIGRKVFCSRKLQCRSILEQIEIFLDGFEQRCESLHPSPASKKKGTGGIVCNKETMKETLGFQKGSSETANTGRC